MSSRFRVEYLKDRIIEFIKYDQNHVKYPFVLLVRAYIYTLRTVSKHSKAFDIASQVFRTGWAGSDTLGSDSAKFYFKQHKDLGRKVVNQSLKTIEPTPGTAKFIEQPLLMFNGVITVLKNPVELEKGVIIINYSYYFSLLLKFFDVNKLASRFHIILEPSWAGLCETNILAYTQYDFPVFVQVYEQRDKIFIESLASNLIPIDVGPSWFINHKNFTAAEPTITKDIDIIMVAAWAKFKRHKAFFKAVQSLKETKPDLNITLVGYPVDMHKEEIISLAERYDLQNNISIFEWITPEEVASLQKRSKVNVLWSKFEGNNRAIIEGMFCDIPVVMREGHNYGEKYDFINSQTGCFADEKTLAQKVLSIVNKDVKLSPRDYVLNNRSCEMATIRMSNAIGLYEASVGRTWNEGLAVKTNELHGMGYFDKSFNEFEESYEWLRKTLL
jgi:glycosyltransferase involved in cell wall biosynthesis